MQATVVMLIALGGLGCQNPISDVSPLPPATGALAASDLPPLPPAASAPAGPYERYPVPSYPAPFGSMTDARWHGIGGDPSDDVSFGSCLRDTFCSFFIGRSPDVPSAREIEAIYNSGRYGY